MQREPDLPPELADIETQLRQLSLPDTRINREQLFYQAGWAAARANVVPASSLLWPVRASPTAGPSPASTGLAVVSVVRTVPLVA